MSVLEVHREMIEATTMGEARFDPRWRHVDRNGHLHIVHVEGGSHPQHLIFTIREVEDPESRYIDRDGDEQVETYFECRICHDTVEPKFKHYADGPHYIPGLITYEIDGQQVTKEEAEKFVGEIHATSSFR